MRGVQLRYSYRLDPQPRHRAALGKAFGCARVVFNDGLAARHQAHQAGQPYLTDAELSARLTAAKATSERAFDWEPVAVLGAAARPDHVARVGAALWCETVRDVDDLTFLLLPRLAGTAEKAWGAAGVVRWPEHRDALARHERLCAQDGLTFFSAARP